MIEIYFFAPETCPSGAFDHKMIIGFGKLFLVLNVRHRQLVFCDVRLRLSGPDAGQRQGQVRQGDLPPLALAGGGLKFCSLLIVILHIV